MLRADPSRKRCAIYTRKSSEEGLDQESNSLEAQREACEAYIRSQQHEGWVSAKQGYDGRRGEEFDQISRPCRSFGPSRRAASDCLAFEFFLAISQDRCGRHPAGAGGGDLRVLL